MKSKVLFISVLITALGCCVESVYSAAGQPPEQMVQNLQEALRDPEVQRRIFQLFRDRFAGQLVGERAQGLLRAGQNVLNLVHNGDFSDALGLMFDDAGAPAVDQGEALPENPTPFQQAQYYSKQFGAHHAWYLSPLIELGEVLALDSKSVAGQATGSLTGQLSGIAATMIPGPDYFFNTYYRILERIRRITRSQDIARVIRELPAEERQRLRSVRNAQLVSLALSGGLRIAQLVNKKTLNNNLLSVPIYIASMFVAWRRHAAIRREYGRLLKRAQLLLRQRKQEEKERDRLLDRQLREMWLKEVDVADHADQSGGDKQEEGAV